MCEKDVLIKNGFSNDFSNSIINQNYKEFNNILEINTFFTIKQNNTLIDIIYCFLNEQSIEEIYKEYKKEIVDNILSDLKKTNTSIEEIIAYIKYSNNSKIISNIKRNNNSKKRT